MTTPEEAEVLHGLAWQGIISDVLGQYAVVYEPNYESFLRATGPIEGREAAEALAKRLSFTMGAVVVPLQPVAQAEVWAARNSEHQAHWENNRREKENQQ